MYKDNSDLDLKDQMITGKVTFNLIFDFLLFSEKIVNSLDLNLVQMTLSLRVLSYHQGLYRTKEKGTFDFSLKGVSTGSPPPLFDFLGGENTHKVVIRAHKKFGQKRTNRYKVMVKNPKKYFYYGF